MNSREEIHQRILAVMQEMFDIDPADVTLQSRLYEDLDIDSIDAVDLVIELKKITGRKIQPEDHRHDGVHIGVGRDRRGCRYPQQPNVGAVRYDGPGHDEVGQRDGDHAEGRAPQLRTPEDQRAEGDVDDRAG